MNNRLFLFIPIHSFYSSQHTCISSLVHQKALIHKAPAVHIRSTLSGSSDPLLIVGSFRPQADTNQLILRMTLYNATHVDLSGIAYVLMSFMEMTMIIHSFIHSSFLSFPYV